MIMSALDICDRSDLPRWLCPCCREFAVARPHGPVPPDPPRTIAGYWSITWDGRACYSRRWVGLSREAGQSPKPVIIVCSGHGGDTPLCESCTYQLAGVLADVPDLLHQLELAEVRDTQFVEHGSAAGEDGALNAGEQPWNERAAKARQAIAREIARATAAAHGSTGTVSAKARWLAAHMGRLARRDDMPGFAHRISQAVAEAHTVIDRPARPWYYGRCPDCGQHIYGERATDPDARICCPGRSCSYQASLRAHQQRLLDAGEDRWLTVDELVGAIAKAGAEGEVVTRHQILRWYRHEGLPTETRERPKLVDGKLVVETVNVHRLGDVRAFAAGERVPPGSVTAAELAAAEGVSEAAVWQWVRRGQLEPVRRRAKPLRFRNEEVVRWRDARKAETA